MPLDLIDVAAAPEVWTAGGVPRLASRLTLRGLATLRAFLDRECPGEPTGSAAAVAALVGPGLPLLVWCALSRTEPVTLAEAHAIAAAMTAAEFDRLTAILYRLRPGEAEAAAAAEAEAEGDEGGPPADWGKVVDRLSQARNLSYEQVLDLTPGQLQNAAYEGEPPEPGERELSYDEVCALAERAKAEAEAAKGEGEASDG